MFVSFFPRPKLFFLSAIVWTALAMAFWYGFAGNLFGSSAPGGVGVEIFWSAPSLWFDLYFALCVAIFAGAWMVFAPHPWVPWSILGSALILFTSYFQVQVSVAINSWYGPFYDLVQAALSKSKPVTVEQFYSELSTFAGIALVAVVVGVMTRFFVSHYIFRWRNARNDFYVANWPQLRTIEGASQRGAGGHHAVCDHHGRSRRQSDQCRADALGLPAGSREALQQCHGAAADRLNPLSPGICRSDLVGARNRRAGADRHPAARDRVFQPAGRSGLSQGARARRR